MTSTIRKPMEIQTTSLYGTTNTQGAVSIQGDFGVSTYDQVLSVACTNDANVMCVPWKYNNSIWYAKCMNWQTMASQNNKYVELTVKYIPNGYRL